MIIGKISNFVEYQFKGNYNRCCNFPNPTSSDFAKLNIKRNLKKTLTNQSQQETQEKGEIPISSAEDLDNGKYAMKSLSRENPADTQSQHTKQRTNSIVNAKSDDGLIPDKNADNIQTNCPLGETIPDFSSKYPKDFSKGCRKVYEWGSGYMNICGREELCPNCSKEVQGR